MITNADITVYRRQLTADKKAEFVRTVIRGVHWYADTKVVAGAGGFSGGNVYKIRIPPEALADGQPALAAYLPPDEFAGAVDTAGKWTVNNGDYFCKGIGPEELKKPSELELRHLQYGMVRGWGDNRRGGLPHIRLEGW